MKCTNKTEVWVESGYHGKMVEIPCGSTGPHGEVELCDECREKLEKQYPQGWRHHPGDTCIHGIYHDPNHDCCCWKCEDGIGQEYSIACHCGATLTAPLSCEVECDRCGGMSTVPDTPEQVEEYNECVAKEIDDAAYTGRIVIMRRDECGQESAVITIDDDEAAEYTIRGVEQSYPESTIWTERERNERYFAEQQMLDDEY